MTSDDEERERAGAPPGFEFPLHSETMLSDEELRAVGCLALESTNLEKFIEIVLEDFVGPRFLSFLLEGKMIGYKLDVMKRVVADAIEKIEKEHAMHGSLLKRFEDLCGKISNDLAHRNTVVHGTWSRADIEEVFDWKSVTRQQLQEYFFGDRRNNAIAQKGNGKNPVKASEVMALATNFRDHLLSISILLLEYRRLLASLEKCP